DFYIYFMALWIKFWIFYSFFYGRSLQYNNFPFSLYSRVYVTGINSCIVCFKNNLEGKNCSSIIIIITTKLVVAVLNYYSTATYWFYRIGCYFISRSNLRFGYEELSKYLRSHVLCRNGKIIQDATFSSLVSTCSPKSTWRHYY